MKIIEKELIGFGSFGTSWSDLGKARMATKYLKTQFFTSVHIKLRVF